MRLSSLAHAMDGNIKSPSPSNLSVCQWERNCWDFIVGYGAHCKCSLIATSVTSEQHLQSARMLF